MLEKGANNFNDVMIHAAVNGHLSIVELIIIEEGVNDFIICMIYATDNGHLNIV